MVFPINVEFIRSVFNVIQLVELSKAQDVEAGDGTTSVTVMAGALLGAARVRHYIFLCAICCPFFFFFECTARVGVVSCKHRTIKHYFDALLIFIVQNLLAKGIHPMRIADVFLKCAHKAGDILRSVAIPVDLADRKCLLKNATTSFNSKVCPAVPFNKPSLIQC